MISELDQMKKFAEKEEFRGRLQEKLEEISEQIKVVESLDEQIWNEINPLAVTLKDAEKIAELLKIYESIPKENLEYVEHRADLLQADTIVKKLQNGILAKEIFTNVKDSSIDYVYETWKMCIRDRDTELLLLDEPTTYLDVRYQIQILQLVRRLNEEYGLTIVMVLHDINQALYYSCLLYTSRCV